MDAYQRMLADCEADGHDMTQAKAAYAKHIAAKPAPTSTKADHIGPLVTLGVFEVASVVDEQIAPLEARIDELEASNEDLKARVAALESELAKFVPKPRAVG